MLYYYCNTGQTGINKPHKFWGMFVNQSQFKAMRQHMVESQLRTSDVNDPAILGAMAQVPREAYVPEARASTAYMDRAIPLTEDRALNPPLTIGRLIVEADLAPTDKVLLIGAASGYTAEIVARLAAHVVALEESAELAAQARTHLEARDNITLVEGPLNQGAAAHAPYDVIIVDGAIEELPAIIVTQLAPEGRVVAGIVDRAVTRLCYGVRVGERVAFNPFADMEAVPLPGFAKPKVFSF